ncbi:MAG: FtsX-like permease family protein, partial [Gemmatimonadetes bacterium]|nr:FtsX-like permease family protein [Gemmatimonadota bacterium]
MTPREPMDHGNGGVSWRWRILSRLVGRRNADEVVGDLVEGFHDRSARWSPIRARLWLIRQLLGLPFWLGWDRLKVGSLRHGRGQMTDRKRVARGALRQAFRASLRAPGFPALSGLTLAIGVGAATAIYSVVDGVLVESLPYPDSDRLAFIWHSAPKVNLDQVGTATGLHLVYGEGTRQMTGLATYRATAVNVTGQGDAARVRALQTTASLFPVLGVTPQIGRSFTKAEAAPGGPDLAVVSHGFWSEYLGADPGALGRTLVVNGLPHEIVGVMPAGFAFPRTPAQVMTPLRIDAAAAEFGGFNTESVGRLVAGSTMESLERELNGLLPRAAERFDDIDESTLETTGIQARAQPMKDVLVGPIRTTLWVLLGTVGLLLLIACANIGNLFMARADGRRSEVAVRRALGASGSDLFRQYGAESGLLAVVGASGGMALAFVGVRLLVAHAPSGLPRLDNVGLDGSVAAFAVVISTLAAFFFGTVPLLRQARVQPGNVMRDGARGSTADRARGRRALVALQIAFGLVLLSASGLMLKSFRQVLNVDLGFNATSVLTFRLSLPWSRYPTVESVAAFHHEALDRLEALPGVSSAGVVSRLPLTDDWSGDPLNREEAPLAAGEIPPVVEIAAADPGYFETLGIPLIRGRLLNRLDADTRAHNTVISQSVAEGFWPGEDPIGRRIMQGLPGTGAWSTIVGIVGDTPG